MLEMWKTPFELDMLHNKNGVVINCPTYDAFLEAAEILDEARIRYPNGDTVMSDELVWDRWEDKFCFYVQNETVRRGPMSSAEGKPWSLYIKCTFCSQEDAESFSDSELREFIGY